jgi:hypothetical protein
MAISKYEKYVVRKPAVIKDGKLQFPDKIDVKGQIETGALQFRSPELMKETDAYFEYGIISGDVTLGGGLPGKVVEGSHKHALAELFLFAGTNPNDPSDLGAEVEFYMGDGKVPINTSASIYMPPNMAHFPVVWKNVKRPCIFVVARPAGHQSLPEQKGDKTAESGYEKYVLRKPAIRSKDGKLEYPDKINTKGMVDTGPLVWHSADLAKVTNFFMEHGIISGDLIVGAGRAIGPQDFVEKPHKHDDTAEMFGFLGTNPDDPSDLGAEAEFCLGEGAEMEKVIINTSSMVYVPPGVAHFPLTWKNVKRPCIFLVIPCGNVQRTPSKVVPLKGRTD